MLARTEDEKNKWIEAIKEAYDNEIPAQGVTSTHQPVMTTYEKPTACHYCHKLLKGLYYQGYQCAVCRKNMHKDCISLLLPSVAPRVSLPPCPPAPPPCCC